ncbi:putative Hydrolase (HAD superfamily) protein [Hyphomonas adhaerens MHS-3]|uniref:Putative Hydrolase (HAD superfamily) protein n=1 Tax=Hyphomonas adhaerens MHS-3 TaxID=1280949 RepID=A0A069E1X5_9PROT|nr:HAD family hydrolase [Hyphomonas adhaerens]KCZ83548.1 putative Hydrolase (HAD superfamily) protein [Hyphomonas adhaerens MHS-3]
MIAAVLFDLDDTLLDRTGSLRSFLEDQYGRFSARLGSASFQQWQERFLELDQRGYVPKSEVYPKILKAFGGDLSIAELLLADYSERCCEHARGFPHMRETLEQLRSEGLQLGIITNGWTLFQTRHINALGLDELVDACLISEAEQLRKPDARLFARAGARVGVSLQDCLFIGDNPVADILGAQGAGMQTAWIRRGLDWPADAAPNPGDTLQELHEVVELVQDSRGVSR